MASCSEMIEDLQKELTCPICMEFLTNPVSIECGHSFCHDCLLRSWQGVSPPFLCPECRSDNRMKEFKANIQLEKLAAIAKNLRPRHLQYSEGHKKCKVHQKVERLLCEDEQCPICLSCSQSQEHEAHRLQCIDEAADDFRGRLQAIATALWKKSEGISQRINSEKVKFEWMEKEIDIQKEIIVSEFQKMKRFLDEDMNAYLSNLQAQGTDNLKGLSKTISELTHQDKELKKRVTDLMGESKKLDLDLLQDMKGVVHRNELLLQEDIKSFGIHLIAHVVPGIMGRIFSFKEDITLDSKTADPGLIISNDLKSVSYRPVKEEAPQNRGRLTDFAQVLGTQSFNSGRHYWEVEVPDNTLWCVGICLKAKESQEFFVLSSEKTANSSYFLYALAQHSLYPELHRRYRQITEPNLKVGIFLDYERGEISFYDANEGYVIYTFPSISFLGPLIPFFCLSKKISTDDCSLIVCP